MLSKNTKISGKARTWTLFTKNKSNNWEKESCHELMSSLTVKMVFIQILVRKVI